MGRGDSWLSHVDPHRASETAWARPTTTRTGYPFQALLTPVETRLKHASRPQAEHGRSPSLERATRPVGLVRDSTMTPIDSALRVQLAL